MKRLLSIAPEPTRRTVLERDLKSWRVQHRGRGVEPLCRDVGWSDQSGAGEGVWPSPLPLPERLTEAMRHTEIQRSASIWFS